jgi:hypothetical protein
MGDVGLCYVVLMPGIELVWFWIDSRHTVSDSFDLAGRCTFMQYA